MKSQTCQVGSPQANSTYHQSPVSALHQSPLVQLQPSAFAVTPLPSPMLPVLVVSALARPNQPNKIM